MDKNQLTKEKICTFFVSDYHFEMITLPYIEKNLNQNKDIMILTEKNLTETMQTLLNKMNFKKDKKTKFLNIDWKNDDLDKFKKIKENVENNRDMIIFIKGKENYISNINKNIEKWVKDIKNVKVIDCYEMEEIGENIDEVMSHYNKILRTSGEKEIEKLF